MFQQTVQLCPLLAAGVCMQCCNVPPPVCPVIFHHYLATATALHQQPHTIFSQCTHRIARHIKYLGCNHTVNIFLLPPLWTRIGEKNTSFSMWSQKHDTHNVGRYLISSVVCPQPQRKSARFLSTEQWPGLLTCSYAAVS